MRIINYGSQLQRKISQRIKPSSPLATSSPSINEKLADIASDQPQTISESNEEIYNQPKKTSNRQLLQTSVNEPSSTLVPDTITAQNLHEDQPIVVAPTATSSTSSLFNSLSRRIKSKSSVDKLKHQVSVRRSSKLSSNVITNSTVPETKMAADVEKMICDVYVDIETLLRTQIETKRREIELCNERTKALEKSLLELRANDELIMNSKLKIYKDLTIAFTTAANEIQMNPETKKEALNKLMTSLKIIMEDKADNVKAKGDYLNDIISSYNQDSRQASKTNIQVQLE